MLGKLVGQDHTKQGLAFTDLQFSVQVRSWGLKDQKD